MAGLICTLNIPATPLVAATALTVAQLKAPTNHRLKVIRYGLFFNGTSNAGQPVQLRVGRATATFGTFTAATPRVNQEGLPETPLATCGTLATVEPTYTSIHHTDAIHPQLSEVMSSNAFEVAGGSSVGFELTAPAGVNVSGWIEYEE